MKLYNIRKTLFYLFSFSFVFVLLLSSCESNPVTGLSLSNTSLELFRGEERELTVKIFDGDDAFSVTWRSSDSSVVSVADTGTETTVTALSEGTAVITATSSQDSYYQEECEVKVSQCGTIDPEYGEDGVVVVDINDEIGITYSMVYDAVRYDSASILVGSEDDTDFIVTRLLLSGEPDTSFGGGDGIAYYPDSVNAEELRCFDVYADGRILAGGIRDLSPTDVTVGYRYDADGNLDATFNGDGIMPLVYAISIEDLEILASGSFAAIGTRNYNEMDRLYINIREEDGGTDSSFGSDGTAYFSNADYTSTAGYKLGEQADGKILALGSGVRSSDSGKDLILARFNTDGSLDSDFGTDSSGYAVIEGNETFYYGPVSLLLHDDGSITVGGTIHADENTDEDIFLARFTAAGVFDTSFGSNGIVEEILDDYRFSLSALITDDAGNYIVGTSNAYYKTSGLFRYTPDGDLDKTFGGTGLVFPWDDGFSNPDIDAIFLLEDEILLLGGSLEKLRLCKYGL